MNYQRELAAQMRKDELYRRILEEDRQRQLHQWQYGDPANHVKFESERSGGLMEAPEAKTKEISRLLRHELDNWIRWGRRRDWMPTSFRCQMGTLYRSVDQEVNSDAPPPPPPQMPIVEGLAAKMERIVVALPAKHRAAFVMYYLDRAVVNGQIANVRERINKASVLGVGVRRYHELVAQAHNIVLREWSR